MSKKGKNLIDHLKQVRQYKKEDYWEDLNDEEKKEWSSYMIARFVSMNKALCPIVNEVQQYILDLPNEIAYKFYLDLLPEDSNFYPYIKKKKGAGKDRVDWVVDKLSEYYNVSKKEAKDYYDTYTKDEDSKEALIEIMSKYPLEEKERKELQKI